MSKRRPKIAAPRRGMPWPAEVVDRGLEIMRETRNATLALKALTTEFAFSKPPARSTLIGWAKRAAPPVVLDNVDPGKKAATGSATAARLENLTVERNELAATLVRELSRPAAALIARRLDKAVEIEDLVDLAADRYRDALLFETQVRADYGENSDEAKGAREGAARQIRDARVDLKLALELSLDTRDLVGIVTRSVNDHLALEGLAQAERGTGDLIVELTVPRPDRKAQDADVVSEDELAERREKRGAG